MTMKLNKTNLVFVYGTLKQGFGNHRVMHMDALHPPRLLCRNAVTKEASYNFISCSPHGGFPYLQKGGCHSVLGEVWMVSEESMSHLDSLEGVPSHYTRERIAVQSIHDTRDEWVCFTYMKTMALSSNQIDNNLHGIFPVGGPWTRCYVGAES
jgi:gamma-glutamylcyclotransferase (GGCT)/AIG2-like uncharacterized protein YtfP